MSGLKLELNKVKSKIKFCDRVKVGFDCQVSNRVVSQFDISVRLVLASRLNKVFKFGVTVFLEIIPKYFRVISLLTNQTLEIIFYHILKCSIINKL